MAGGLILPLFKFERPERALTGVREGGENNMRLDKYLKVSRLIKRRTIANEACDAGRVTVNGKTAKASYDVKIGDVIEIGFGERTVRAEVTRIVDSTKKENAAEMYRYI